RHIDLNLETGQSLALTGRTGSGKTTFVSLLLRFYEVTEGKILLDDKPIQTIDPAILRSRLALIQQDPFLFRGSLLENIILGDNDITEEKINHAVELVGFRDYLHRTGRDLNFQVQEKGSNLSLGERQLIAFLRVLVRNPDIVILDEATANVDSETEFLIQKATQEIMKNKTCLIIAHRLSTIENCDQMLVLNRGEVIQRGQPKDLLRKKEVREELES
ncbi:MAG: ATP-binding cassette domain-containing protein, partial [Bdellovibrionales bacterium]